MSPPDVAVTPPIVLSEPKEELITENVDEKIAITRKHEASLTVPSEEVVRQWTVRRGDSLWRIASDPEVYGRGYRWLEIYEANKNVITDPDLIFPDQIFVIPR